MSAVFIKVADNRTTFPETPATNPAIIKDRLPSARVLVADRSTTSRRLFGDCITRVAYFIPTSVITFLFYFNDFILSHYLYIL